MRITASIAVLFVGSAAAQPLSNPLSRLPASQAPLCTTLNPDGTFSPVPDLCGTDNCVADPNRNGAFYCGIDQAGWYGKGRYSYFNGQYTVNGCRADLAISDTDSTVCGGLGGLCVRSGDAQCTSGNCRSQVCRARVSTVGSSCTSQSSCGTLASDPTVLLYCRPSDSTCQRTVPTGGDCSDGGVASCASFAEYCSTAQASPGNQFKCLAQSTTVGASCAADNKFGCAATGSASGDLYCLQSANGPVCAPVLTDEYSSCYGDLSGNACASPRYCTGADAPAGSQYQCRTKASLGGSCRFDPVNGCSTGLYCRTTDQTCQTLSTQIGQSCGTDSNACSASAGLYCVASTQLCAKKATSVGASCSFDLTNGCSSTSSRQQLYCRNSDATCQVRLTTVGADCRADPVSACGTARAADGSTISLYCSAPSYLCAAKLGAGASCSSNPAQACSSPYYCSSNTDVCLSQVTSEGGNCNADPYAQCGLNPALAYPGYNGQLYPLVQVDRNGNQVCSCARSPGLTSVRPVPGTFSLTAVGDDCSSDPTFACGYTAAGVKLYCALSTNTCQARVTTVGASCAFDYLSACGITTDGTLTQLYPSIPVGSSGHADCTCVTQADVVVRPSSRARARARARRNLSLCPGSHTACPVGNGFECIDVENNIEQCGGCAGDGGVDCTSLAGVAAVGCVGGQCEIWACELGYDFNSTSGICV